MWCLVSGPDRKITNALGVPVLSFFCICLHAADPLVLEYLGKTLIVKEETILGYFCERFFSIAVSQICRDSQFNVTRWEQKKWSSSGGQRVQGHCPGTNRSKWFGQIHMPKKIKWNKTFNRPHKLDMWWHHRLVFAGPFCSKRSFDFALKLKIRDWESSFELLSSKEMCCSQWQLHTSTGLEPPTSFVQTQKCQMRLSW